MNPRSKQYKLPTFVEYLRYSDTLIIGMNTSLKYVSVLNIIHIQIVDVNFRSIAAISMMDISTNADTFESNISDPFYTHFEYRCKTKTVSWNHC